MTARVASLGAMRVEPPLPPRRPEIGDDLPAGGADQIVQERLADEVDLTGDLTGLAVPNLRLRGSRLRAADLSEAQLRGLDASDLLVEEGSWANAALDEASLVRLEASGLRATGARFTETTVADATFQDCRLDLASFRFAELDRIVFRDCRLEEADFYGAKLRSVLFERCVLAAATFETAALERCELRGCDLTDIAGVDRLAGSRMPLADVVQIAALLATAAGIEILD
jgi:uncharacterized protein YjbI with pentapeptide repeats